MSSLETSVTLEDVFTVVEGKRVPLAPELAGYLSLEIADGTDAGGGDVDPKTVFISEEGTVALVQPKNQAPFGDAEASVRTLLGKLLEASGSGTPALTTAAKRKPGNGLPALVEELEAALIPVNRAAGRRALARLAREVKRVTLGVGRNASMPAGGPASKAPLSIAPHARPVLRKKESTDQMKAVKSQAKPFSEEPGTTKRANEITELASQMNAVDSARAARVQEPSPRPPAAPLPPPPAAKISVVPPPPPPKREPTNIDLSAHVPPAPKAPDMFGGDEVDSLLDAFNVSGTQGAKEMSRDLKAMAGLEPTPPPPDAQTLAELTKDVGRDLPRSREPSIDGESIDALLALSDTSMPVKPPGKPPEPTPPPVMKAPPPLAPPPPFTPPPPLAPPPSTRKEASAPPPAAKKEKEPSLPPPEVTKEEKKSERRPATRAKDDAPPPASAPPATKKSGGPRERPRAPKTGLALLVLLLLVLVGGTAAIWKFAPQLFTGKRHAPPPPPTTPVPPPPKCKATLVLTDVPTNAEILLRVGQAPVDVERMPVGTRLELVGTAEGSAPRRVVITPETPWDKGPDGKPRVETPLQLDPSKAKPGAVDPWPPAEPGSQVGGSGPPGTVHVVSNVRGAEVWLLAGLGPEARIEQLKCDADIDVLLAGPTTFRKRLHLGEKDIAAQAMDAAGNRVVSLSAK